MYSNDLFPAYYGAGYRPEFSGDFEASSEDRLTHLVMVDGRLVDVWREPVIGTRWEHHADQFDRERRPAPPPPAPPYARALAWLDHVCGGRAAVLALTGDPLVDEGLDLPEAPTPSAQERLATTAKLLDVVADRCFEPELAVALRRALVLVHDVEPEVVAEAASAARVAGGVIWAVAKANALLRPQGDLRMGRIQEELALVSTISTPGKVIERALVGYREQPATHRWRPDGLPDLLALGHPDLLLGSVRRRLVRVRDRALEAEAAASAP